MAEPSSEPPPLDVARLVRVLEDHGVEYLLVGGVAAIAHGATRATRDFDCLARRTAENLDGLATAMRELGARLYVEGLSDDEAARLPVQFDGQTLAGMEISTWRTEAGDFDVLVDLPDTTGRRRSFDELAGRACSLEVGGRRRRGRFWVAALGYEHLGVEDPVDRHRRGPHSGSTSSSRPSPAGVAFTLTSVCRRIRPERGWLPRSPRAGGSPTTRTCPRGGPWRLPDNHGVDFAARPDFEDYGESG